MLELSFSDLDLRTLCEKSAKARSRFGEDMARCLIARLADLWAADTLDDLAASDLIHDEGDGTDDKFIMNLGEKHRLVFRQSHRIRPARKDGSLDKIKVTRVQIIKIVKL